jgi:hypothetical protein
MNTLDTHAIGHSATVHMQLFVNGDVLPIAQLGPNFLVLKNPIDHPPVDAEITLCIDGHEDRWRVRLPDGIHSGWRKTAISKYLVFNGAAVG